MKKLIVELPDEEYENIITLAAVNIGRGGRFPYKGIVMYALNAIRRAKIIDDKAADEEATTNQEPKWIPVSERMPEEDVDVLVTLECGLIGIMQKKLADDDNGEPCYIWQDFEGEEHEVIAWMPLPKPYEADRSEHEKGEA